MIKEKLTKPLLALAGLAALGAGVGVSAIASAQSAAVTDPAVQITSQEGWQGHLKRGRHEKMMLHKGPGAMGTVSAVNGTTLTVTGEDGTTYTVEAAEAKVHKTVEIAVSDIAVGDHVGVMGEVSGTSVTAAHIMDGMPIKFERREAQQ